MLKESTCYMLRNDGYLIECKNIHPYIRLNKVDSLKTSIELLFKTHLADLRWLYNNTLLQEVKNNIEEFVLMSSNFYSKYKEELLNLFPEIKFTKVEVDEKYDLLSTFEYLDNCLNQEFCRVRTSGKYNKNLFNPSHEIFFRISSIKFDWFDIIWKLINDNKNWVSKITISSDPQAIGKNIIKSIGGVKIDSLDVEEFLTLSGNPILEDLESKIIQNRGGLLETYPSHIYYNNIWVSQKIKEEY